MTASTAAGTDMSPSHTEGSHTSSPWPSAGARVWRDTPRHSADWGEQPGLVVREDAGQRTRRHWLDGQEWTLNPQVLGSSPRGGTERRPWPGHLAGAFSVSNDRWAPHSGVSGVSRLMASGLS